PPLRPTLFPYSTLFRSTQIPRLELVSGCNDPLDMASLTSDQLSGFISSVFHYPTDFIVLDLSAGTSATTLDFFLLAQDQIVVMTDRKSTRLNSSHVKIS